MKTAIIYHSSTGNTRLCAETLAAELRRLGHECAAIDVRRLRKGEAPEEARAADLIGVASPTYAFRPAVNLMEYIDSLPPLEPKPGFVLNTCSAIKSNTLTMLAKALQRKNVFTIGRLTVHAEEAYPLFRFRFFKANEGKPDERGLERVRRFAREIDEKAKRVLSDESEQRSALRKRLYINAPTPFHLLALVSTRKNQLRGMFGKKVIADRCAACGACAAACPTRSIELAPVTREEAESSRDIVIEERQKFERKFAENADGGEVITLPRFASTCMACYACYNLCPENAIVTSICRNHPRYRGPQKWT